MMSVIALSLPDDHPLRKVLTVKLIAVFIAVVGASISRSAGCSTPSSREGEGGKTP